MGACNKQPMRIEQITQAVAFACIAALVAFIGSGAIAQSRIMTAADEQAGWSAVGRLNITGQGFCTATLVAPDLVLTAAHCLMDRRTGKIVSADKVHFLAGFRIGVYAAHGRGESIAIADGYSRARKVVGSDIGVIRLQEPMPPSVVPVPLGNGMSEELDITLLSYGMDRAQLLSMEHGCRFKKRMYSVIFTDCEGIPGVSGAPLLQHYDGRPILVAIASSIVAQPKTLVPVGDILAVEAANTRLDQMLRQLIGTQVYDSIPAPRGTLPISAVGAGVPDPLK